jgi:hypothetical protein
MIPRRSFSPERIASFMSWVMRSLSDIFGAGRECVASGVVSARALSTAVETAGYVARHQAAVQAIAASTAKAHRDPRVTAWAFLACGWIARDCTIARCR